MANFAMWSLIIVTAVIVVVVIIGIRNSVVAARSGERIAREGTETSALILNAVQHQNQNAPGRLSLNLTVEFTAGSEKVVANKDVMVKIFNAEAFRPGQRVTVSYNAKVPSQIVVLNEGSN